MYLIIVYDAEPKRGIKLLKFLRKHLIWIQNSVFEGEVTKSQLELIKYEIKKIINNEKDSVIIYRFESQKYTSREIVGLDKNSTDSFI